MVGATRGGLAPAKEGVGKNPGRYKLVEPGTIFYNPMRILLGSIALVDEGQPPGITSPDYVVFRTRSGMVHPRWFYYWLRSEDGQAFIRTLARGAVRERMLFRRLAGAEIEVAEYASQLWFASAIKFVERARASAEVQLEAAKALPAARLRSVFDYDAAQKWPRRHVSALCKSIDYGYTASADHGALGPRYLRITDIQDGKIEWPSVPGCRISAEDEKSKALADGDIVFARTGATTGKSILITRPPRAVFASYLIRLRPTDDVSPEYLYAFFQSDGYWRQVRALARGGAQPNVNATLLGSIEVPVSPRSEQERLCTELASDERIGDAVRRASERQLVAVDALPAALLRRAFSGEL